MALVIRGRKGTGKSKFADVLRRILGGHAFKASRADQIVGKFNSHLADKLLLVAEESFFAGGHADRGSPDAAASSSHMLNKAEQSLA